MPLKDNPYSKQLYIFLSENRDSLFTDFAIEHREVVDAAYHLCAKMLADREDAKIVRSHITLLRTVHPQHYTVIMSIAWTLLSVLPKRDCLTETVIDELHAAVKGSRHFHSWQTFLSAFLQKYGRVSINLPHYESTAIIETSDSDKVTTESQKKADGTDRDDAKTIHQTLVFPNVQQFNNNPQRVINITSPSEQ